MPEQKTYRDWRKERGYTTKYVAGILEISPTTLTAKERGDVKFTKLQQKMLCDVYKISIEQIIE